MAVIDLVDSIKPGSINYSNVMKSASTDKDKLLNAKYAISMVCYDTDLTDGAIMTS
jgi:hypothetical protein